VTSFLDQLDEPGLLELPQVVVDRLARRAEAICQPTCRVGPLAERLEQPKTRAAQERARPLDVLDDGDGRGTHRERAYTLTN
jgi:hypothetical protein